MDEDYRPDAPHDAPAPTDRTPHPAADELAATLHSLDHAAAGDLRDALVVRCFDLALGCGIPAGVRTDGVGARVVLHLPAGPVSFPLPHDPRNAPQERSDTRRNRIDHFVSQVRGVDPSRSLYHLTRAAARWLAALSLEDRARIGGIAVTFDAQSAGMTVSVLPPNSRIVTDPPAASVTTPPFPVHVRKAPDAAQLSLARHQLDDHEPPVGWNDGGPPAA